MADHQPVPWTWTITKAQLEKLDSVYTRFLRHMIREEWQRRKTEKYERKKNGVEEEFAKLRLTNVEIMKISKIEKITDFVQRRQEDWIGHCVRADDKCFIKQLTFAEPYKNDKKKRGILNTIYQQVLKRFNDRNIDEKVMITKFKRRDLRVITVPDHNSNNSIN